jgi:hypothetical protein
MIHIDLSNDAPMIETNEGPPVSTEALLCITTVTKGGDADRVLWTPVGESKPQEVAVAASVRSTNKMGKNVIEYSVRERFLPSYGSYEIQCWTRRGQERSFHLTFAPIDGDDSHYTMTIGPTSTPTSWVTEEEVYPVKGTSFDITLSL